MDSCHATSEVQQGWPSVFPGDPPPFFGERRPTRFHRRGSCRRRATASRRRRHVTAQGLAIRSWRWPRAARRSRGDDIRPPCGLMGDDGLHKIRRDTVSRGRRRSSPQRWYQPRFPRAQPANIQYGSGVGCARRSQADRFAAGPGVAPAVVGNHSSDSRELLGDRTPSG